MFPRARTAPRILGNIHSSSISPRVAWAPLSHYTSRHFSPRKIRRPLTEKRVPDRVCQSYKVLVGMEIHVQLGTKSKMFSGAANGFGGEPNSQVDPVILGLPGVLPVMNKRAVEYSIKVGLALGCTIARHTKWDRKSYYYPDLPKNYQISQYDSTALRGRSAFRVGNLKDGSVRNSSASAAPTWKKTPAKLMHESPPADTGSITASLT